MANDRSFFRRLLGWLQRNPGRALFWLGMLLLAVIVLQNLEPTSLKILFWTVAQVPKLVLLLGAMVLGALIWEVLRRRTGRHAPPPRRPHDRY